MFADYIWVFLAVMALGILAGFLISKGLYERRNVGTLRIDRSDPDDGAYFFLEVTNLKRIQNGKLITMRVKEENYISQE